MVPHTKGQETSVVPGIVTLGYLTVLYETEETSVVVLHMVTMESLLVPCTGTMECLMVPYRMTKETLVVPYKVAMVC